MVCQYGMVYFNGRYVRDVSFDSKSSSRRTALARAISVPYSVWISQET